MPGDCKTLTAGLMQRVFGGWDSCLLRTYLFSVVVGMIAGASGIRLVQYGTLGSAWESAINLIGMHACVEGALRPASATLGGTRGSVTPAAFSPDFCRVVGHLEACLCVRVSPPAVHCWAVVLDRAGEVPVLAVVSDAC